MGSLTWPILGARRHPWVWLLFHRSLAGEFRQVCIPDRLATKKKCKYEKEVQHGWCEYPVNYDWRAVNMFVWMNATHQQIGTTNHKVLFFAQETTDGDLLGEVRHWTQPPDEVSSWSERLTVLFVSAVDNLWLQKKLHSIKQRPEENTTAYILWYLSEAKLACPTAWALGEEGNVVSFLKGLTDRAFAGHLLRTVQANTLSNRGGPGTGG